MIYLSRALKSWFLFGDYWRKPAVISSGITFLGFLGAEPRFESVLLIKLYLASILIIWTYVFIFWIASKL